MQAASPRFVQALAESNPIYSRATLVETDGTRTEIPLDEGSGDVTLDEEALIRGGLDLNIVPGENLDFWVPEDLDSPLSPNGNEIEVARGITFPDNTVEEILLGTFRIDDSDSGRNRDGDVTVSVSAFDRSIYLSEAGMQEEEEYPHPGMIEAGTNCTEAIENLILAVWLDAYPDVPLDLTSTDVVLPALSFEVDQDRWDLCKGIAEACNCRLYMGPTGQPMLVPIADSVLAQATYAEGEGGVLLDASKRYSREGAVNRVKVTGENSSTTPVVGIALDEDTASPTYYFGKFGKKTLPWSSPYIIEEGQAEDVAHNILARKRGIPKTVSFQSLVDPRLEPGDTVRVTSPDLKIDELHLISSVSIPLGHEGEMSCETRALQVQS